jgi:hypothetical protein
MMPSNTAPLPCLAVPSPSCAQMAYALPILCFGSGHTTTMVTTAFELIREVAVVSFTVASPITMCIRSMKRRRGVTPVLHRDAP